jgi:hypothetical protein
MQSMCHLLVSIDYLPKVDGQWVIYLLRDLKLFLIYPKGVLCKLDKFNHTAARGVHTIWDNSCTPLAHSEI